MHRTLLPSLIVLIAVSACGYRPVRFADAPVATRARDDLPVARPAPIAIDPRMQLAEVYMRRPVLDALDASAFPEAGDVNALDEVVASSWFTPDSDRLRTLGGYSRKEPVPPLSVVATGADGAPREVRDARGSLFVIRIDRPDRPEMTTASEAIASRLLWSFGYSTPEAHVIELRRRDVQGAPRAAAWFGASDSVRACAIRLPDGVDLGPTPSAMMRDDDPNDRVPHRDRRTLRALAVVGAWLDMPQVGTRITRDYYVGSRGCGHVRHLLVGLDGALGASRVPAPRRADELRADAGPRPVANLYTLGFAPDPPVTHAQREHPGLGAIDDMVDPKRWSPSLPYEPVDRILPADGYWAARRLLEMSDAALADAVAGGELSDPRAARTLLSILKARRESVARMWFGTVTPLRATDSNPGGLVLHNDAARHGFEDASTWEYTVEYLDHDGAEVAHRHAARPGSPCFELGYPDGILPARIDYLVVRVTGRSLGIERPRAAEFHLVRGRLVGVRH